MRSRRSVFPAGKGHGSLPLPFNEPARPLRPVAPTTDTVSHPQSTSRLTRLWYGLHLPALTFESHVASAERSNQVAVVDERDGQRVIVALNLAGEQCGLATGMTLSAALALVPELASRQFEPRRLREALEALAQTAEDYTAVVVLRPPDGLLLEIGASLKLFGGLKALAQRIARDVRAGGHAVSHAVAPTPSAAAWLSVWSPGTIAVAPLALNRALRDLPIDSTGWSASLLGRLRASGVRTLAQCRRLPRAGFARRFGPAALLDLDRAYGDSPEPVRSWRARPVFRSEVELHGEIDDDERLLEASDVLFERFARYLTQRQATARAIVLRFFPLSGKATTLSLRLNGAGTDRRRWYELAKLKLERLTLTAPAVLVELTSRAIETATAATAPLALTSGRDQPLDTEAHRLLIERLRARLGNGAIRALRLAADQRPERAMSHADPLTNVTGSGPSPRFELGVESGRWQLQRPLWLLPEPELLGSVESLIFHNGPERIETGWWDGAEVARDYYVARTADAIDLWVFRERGRSPRWYLHGYFA